MSSELEINKTYNESCLDTMAKMPEGFIDLTVTSPPYDNLRSYNDDIDKSWGDHVWKPIIESLYRVTKEGGVVVWVVGDATINGSETGTSFKQALYAMECGFRLHDTMIYQKINYPPLYPSVKRYDSVFEYMFIWTKNTPKTFNPIKDVAKAESSKGRLQYKISYTQRDGSTTTNHTNKDNGSDVKKRTGIWPMPNGHIRGLEHPAVFPETLANDHILSWSNEGDLVYDPFMGSGTVAKMSIINRRNWIGSEISEDYCEIIKKRIEGGTVDVKLPFFE